MGCAHNMVNDMMRITKKLHYMGSKIKRKMISLTKWGPDRYVYLGEKERLCKNYREAVLFIQKGLEKYPGNPELNKVLAKVHAQKKDWQKAVLCWHVYFTHTPQTGSISDFEQAVIACEKAKDFKAMDMMIEKGVEQYPDNIKLNKMYYQAAMDSSNWETAVKRLEQFIENFQKECSYHESIMLSVMKQLVGDHATAKRLLEQTIEAHAEELNNDDKGYQKIRLFDNGETVIDFYKQLRASSKVIVTFDSINKVLKKPPFGFKVLNEQKLDIIAVRKRKGGTYQQDLSKTDFESATQTLLSGYDDKIAYGYSLGAYLALYLTSELNCRILALSPRISPHPKYGKKKVIEKEPFNHDVDISENPAISPIIVFDPKSKMDAKYVNGAFKKAFPNGRFIEIPYAGHGMARHLLNMKMLKDYIISFINNDAVPKYNRKHKSKSSIYFRLLAKECLKRNKLKWSEILVNRSLEMVPDDVHAIKVKIDLHDEIGGHSDTSLALETAIKRKPKQIKFRLMLIDHLLAQGKLDQALKQINQSFDIFGRKAQLVTREKQIDEMMQEQLVTRSTADNSTDGIAYKGSMNEEMTKPTSIPL